MKLSRGFLLQSAWNLFITLCEFNQKVVLTEVNLSRFCWINNLKHWSKPVPLWITGTVPDMISVTNLSGVILDHPSLALPLLPGHILGCCCAHEICLQVNLSYKQLLMHHCQNMIVLIIHNVTQAHICSPISRYMLHIFKFTVSKLKNG